MKSRSLLFTGSLFALLLSSCGPEEEASSGGAAPAPEQPAVAETKPQPAKPAPETPMKNAPDPESDRAYIGMEIGKAEAMAEKNGLKHRVTFLDGKPRPATRDYRPDRLNFSVEKGKVTEVSRG